MHIRPLLDAEKLSLTNDGQLEVFFLGVGGAFSAAHNHTNFFVVKGQNHLLVDFGTTGPSALRSLARLQPTDIKAVLPTHCHADHAGGIEMFALMSRYITKRTPWLYAEPLLASQLWEETLKGGCERNEVSKNGVYLGLGDYFEVVHPEPVPDMPRPTFRVDVFQSYVKGGDHPIKVELFRNWHVPPTSMGWWDSMIGYGLLIDDRIWFSGDTQFEFENVMRYSERAEWMFHDTGFYPGVSHATLDQLRTLPSEVKSKMFNVHYGDNFKDFDNSDFAGWTQQGVRYIFD